MRPLRRWFALAAAPLCGCAAPHALLGGGAGPWEVGFRGPGRLAIVWEAETPAGDLERVLVVYDGRSARALEVAEPLDARWLSARELLVGVEAPPAEEGGLPRVQLLRLDLESGAHAAFAAPDVYFDPEPAPDGRSLALGVQLDDLGTSELRIVALHGEAGAPETLFERREALDEPRFSPDGARLVVTRTIEDPNAESMQSSASLEGVGFGWPRLFRARRDLAGPISLLHDGAPGEELAPGGSLPLWWDARGIWARQRRGLARCDPNGAGCEIVYTPGKHKRVLSGRARGDTALLLVVDTETAGGERVANEIHRVDLVAGRGEVVHRASADRFPLELDWGP
jgi:hypothetical protein